MYGDRFQITTDGKLPVKGRGTVQRPLKPSNSAGAGNVQSGQVPATAPVQTRKVAGQSVVATKTRAATAAAAAITKLENDVAVKPKPILKRVKTVTGLGGTGSNANVQANTATSTTTATETTTETTVKKLVNTASTATVTVTASAGATTMATSTTVIEKTETRQVLRIAATAKEIEQIEGQAVAAPKLKVDEKLPSKGKEEEQREKVERAPPGLVPWQDLDAEDADDPAMVSEYVVEIFEYMRQIEVQTMPNPNYMDDQKELAWKMRGILIDWMIEVHQKFRLLPETLFLAVNIIDRFLSHRVVSLIKFQLVGVTALFIAAKYEEIVAPSIQNFIYMADGGYTDEEVLNAERYVLSVLDFNLSYPNPMNFLRRNSKADQYDLQSRTVAKYLMEITLLDHRFLACPPSLVAASSLYLARKILDRGPWVSSI